MPETSPSEIERQLRAQLEAPISAPPAPSSPEPAASAESVEDDPLGRFWAFLDAIVPPDQDDTIEDMSGEVHQLPSAISGRQQITIARTLKVIIDRLRDRGIITKLEEAWAKRSMTGGMVTAMEALDDDTIAMLDKTFEVAYPKVLAAAQANCSEESSNVASSTLTACDCFAMEAVVGSLLPFANRLLRQGGAVITRLAAATPN